MKKTLALAVAVCAVLGLTACNESDSSFENGEKRCDNNAVEIYNDGAWTIETACEGKSVCNDVTHVCDAPAATCDEGAKRCENNAIEICADNVWTTQEACADKVCDADSLSCLVIECEANWQRCNGNIVEICGAKGQYEPIAPAACDADSRCLENSDAHTATCVECKENADCKDPDTSICHGDNTCVACVPGEHKCLADGTLLTCDANGAWPATGTACPKGHECLADATACTPKDGYCTSEDDCKNTLYPWCSDETALCECREGQTTCTIKDGQAKQATCSGSIWSDDSHCTGRTPVCNAEQTACTECTDDLHCGEFYRCDLATSKCEARLADSTITGCTTSFIDADRQVINGHYSNPISGLTPKALCGRADQAIKDYAALSTENYGEFLYKADLSGLADGEYRCIFSFQNPGEMPVACSQDWMQPTIDLRELAPVDEHFKYTAVTIIWDHIIDFEDCPKTETESNDSCPSGLSYINGTTTPTNWTITGQSLQLGAGGSARVTMPNGVSKLRMDIIMIGNMSSGSAELLLNDKTLIKHRHRTYELSTVFEKEINVSDSAEFVITPDQPIIIDNLKWMNYP